MSRPTRVRPVIRAWIALALVLSLAAGAACDGSDEAAPGPNPVLDVADKAIRTGRQAKDRRVDDLAKRQLAFRQGWQATYSAAYIARMQRARDEGPAAFRSDVFGEWFGLILLGLLIGVLMRVLLSVRLPHWKRLEGKADKEPGLLRRGAMAGLKGLGTLKKGLVVVAGPSADAADEWMMAVQASRDAERHLALASRAALELDQLERPKPPAEADGDEAEGHEDADPSEAAEPKAASKKSAAKKSVAKKSVSPAQHLAKAIDAWRAEVASVRRHLEAEGSTASHRRAKAFLSRIDKSRKRGRTLAVELTRALAREDVPGPNEWTDWHAQIKARTEAPSLKKDKGKQVPSWIRTGGWAGAGALAASVLMLAAWAAAGGMPFSLTFLVAFAALVLTIGARVALSRRSDSSLLPGLADRLVVRLAIFVGVVLFGAMLSNMNSAESGLDLGDPPLVDVPASAEAVAVPAPPVSLMPRPRVPGGP